MVRWSRSRALSHATQPAMPCCNPQHRAARTLGVRMLDSTILPSPSTLAYLTEVEGSSLATSAVRSRSACTHNAIHTAPSAPLHLPTHGDAATHTCPCRPACAHTSEQPCSYICVRGPESAVAVPQHCRQRAPGLRLSHFPPPTPPPAASQASPHTMNAQWAPPSHPMGSRAAAAEPQFHAKPNPQGSPHLQAALRPTSGWKVAELRATAWRLMKAW